MYNMFKMNNNKAMDNASFITHTHIYIYNQYNTYVISYKYDMQVEETSLTFILNVLSCQWVKYAY